MTRYSTANGRMIMRHLLLASAITLLLSCRSEGKMTEIRHSPLQATAKIGKIRQWKDGSSSAVYGTLSIAVEGRQLRFANLNCFQLETPDRRSSAIYVDSIASVLEEKYAADASGQVRAEVYWIIPNSQGQAPRQVDLDLIYVEHASCYALR